MKIPNILEPNENNFHTTTVYVNVDLKLFVLLLAPSVTLFCYFMSVALTADLLCFFWIGCKFKSQNCKAATVAP